MSDLKRMQFGGVGVDAEALIQEVLRGEKTATATDAADYDQPWGEYDSGGWEVGDIVEIWDDEPRLRCHIEITEVYTTPFGVTPEKLWREEVCKSAEHFRQVHRECWPELDLTDEHLIAAVHFKRVEAPKP